MPLPITDPVLIFALVMTIFLVVPLLFERAKIPGMIGLILAGVIVGPHGAGMLAQDFTLLSSLGLLYLIFLAGLELDIGKFIEYRRRSIVFGGISFTVPMALSLLIMPSLGYSLPAALLVGAIVGSHTLLAYPIASRLGIVKNGAILAVVGGTLITDTLALAVLAVVAGTVEEGFSALFVLQLVAGLTVYACLVLWGVPRLGRWFFRNVPGQAPAEFLFLLAVLFGVSFLARVAGAEPIIGAFLAGLTLNRLIARTSPLMTRIRFVGNTLFIPFFIFSVGMLVNPAALIDGWDVWIVAGVLIGTVHLGKFAAAWATRGIFRFTTAEGVSMFALSVPQAAATLAVTFVGLEVGLFGETLLNGVIIMIAVTVFVGPALLERFGRDIALEELQKPYDPQGAPERFLIPVSNPATADALLDLAILLRTEDSEEPIYPLMVVREEGDFSAAAVAEAERVLGHAVLHAAAAEIPVVPLTRIDRNTATGIVRGMTETRTSTAIIGWDGKPARQSVFGTVLDQLLERTHQQVLVVKMGHPLNTTRRVVLVLPPASDHHPGFFNAISMMKGMANELDAELQAVVVRESADDYMRHVESVPPETPARVESVGGWAELRTWLEDRLAPEDLVVLLSARRGTVAWHRELEQLPGELARLVPESFIVAYPSEERPAAEAQRARRGLPSALAPDRMLVDLPPMSYPEALHRLLRTAFVHDARLRELAFDQLVESEEQLSSEILPGVFVPNARVPGIREPMIFMATSSEGIAFPHARGPAHIVFLLLSPHEQRKEHLEMLTELAAAIRRSDRLAGFREARSGQDLYDWLRGASV